MFSLLEERLEEALKKARSGEEETSRLSSDLSHTQERLDEKEELIKRLGNDLSENNEEIRNLKESLRQESERQVIID